VSSEPSWKQEDCFPLILETIYALSIKKKAQWVSHNQLVEALLDNPQVIAIITDVKMRPLKYETSEEREIVSNMVAWFSQKITEYEHGLLSKKYRQFHTIEEAWLNLDRIELDGRYAYKMRESRRATKPIFVRERGRTLQLTEEERLRREEFCKFVEELKSQKVSPEEYRKRVMEWQKEHGSGGDKN
jgi:hypothetical protein